MYHYNVYYHKSTTYFCDKLIKTSPFSSISMCVWGGGLCTI